MKRRDFLVKSVTAAGVATVSTTFSSCAISPGRAVSISSDVIERVKHAMLTMQRQSWEQGVAAQAFLELGDYDTVYMMAKEMALRQTSEGRIGVVYTDGASTDGAMGGEALFVAAQRSNDPELKAALERQLEFIFSKAPRNDEGTLYHRMTSPEIWIDSMNTTPPFLAAAGKYDEAIKQIRGMRKVLCNADDKLYSHIWDDGKKKFINKKYWGVGNGWAASGMTRTIGHFPDSKQAESDELIGYVKEVLDSCIKHIRPDGLFHNVIDDPATFVETNLAQMLAYSIFTGVKAGWLSEKYLSYAEKMRSAAHGKVDKYGYVQGVCGAPFFNKSGRATEGQAFFLRMEAAYINLKK